MSEKTESDVAQLVIDNKAEFTRELQALSEKYKCTIVPTPYLAITHDGSWVIRMNISVEDIK